MDMVCIFSLTLFLLIGLLPFILAIIDALIEPTMLDITGFLLVYKDKDAYAIKASPHPTGSIAFFLERQ